MFVVRWIRRPRILRGDWEHGEPTGEWEKTAVLVESRQTEAGPRHRYVCCLGTIGGTLWEGPERDIIDAGQFWTSALVKLSEAGLSEDERERIIAELAIVVPDDVDDSEMFQALLRGMLRESRVRAATSPHAPGDPTT